MVKVICGTPPSEVDQDSLHSVFPLPLSQTWELGRVDLEKYKSAKPRIYVQYEADLAISWVDAGQVDLADKLDRWWLVGVVIAAMHLQRVNPVLVHALEDIVLALNISEIMTGGFGIHVGDPGLSHSSST